MKTMSLFTICDWNEMSVSCKIKLHKEVNTLDM